MAEIEDAADTAWLVCCRDDDPDHDMWVLCWDLTEQQAEAARQELVDRWGTDPLQQWTREQAERYYYVQEVHKI